MCSPGSRTIGSPWVDAPMTIVLTVGDQKLERDSVESALEVDGTLRKREEKCKESGDCMNCDWKLAFDNVQDEADHEHERRYKYQ